MFVPDELAQWVRGEVASRGLDLVQDAVAVRGLVAEVVARRCDEFEGPAAELAAAVYAQVAPFGPLQEHLDDPEVEELWINSPSRVFIAKRGRSELTTTILTPEDVRDLVDRIS